MSKKERQAVWLYPETKMLIEKHMDADNCKSQSEYIEKAVRFYSGYLDSSGDTAVEYQSHVLTSILESIVLGSEQRLSRVLFKLAVETGAVTHMLAALNEFDDDTLIKLRAMCSDEVKRINGIINFEKAVRYPG